MSAAVPTSEVVAMVTANVCREIDALRSMLEGDPEAPDSDPTSEDIQQALATVTKAYDDLVSTFCHQPNAREIGIWNVWNMLGCADHYAYLATAVKP